MKTDDIHRLPPPPLFIIRPPPKPPGDFENLELLNGQCIRQSLNILPTNNNHQFNWLNIFLLILALISLLSCLIIIIFIFVCLKKLKKEEKEYKTYVMTGSLSSTTNRLHSDTYRRTNENYQYRSNCCVDDYYSHQIIPLTDRTLNQSVKYSLNTQCDSSFSNVREDNSSVHHQYECIPEYLLTMKRHCHPSIHCHNQHQSSLPYATFSRSLNRSRGETTTTTNQCKCSPIYSNKIHQEESSTPLISSSIPNEESHSNIDTSKSMIIGWTKRNSSMEKTNQQQNHWFLSQLTKSNLFK